MLDLTFPLTIHHANRCLRAALIALLCACAFSVAIAAPPVQLSGAMVSGGDVGLIAINSTSTRVVFIADRETDATNELYSAPIGGGAVTKLSGTMVAGGDVTVFKISPNGQWVAFVADRVIDNKVELWLAPIDGSAAPASLSGTLGASVIADFQWAPNSGRVVFVVDGTTPGLFEMYSIGTSIGSTVVPLSGTLVPGGDVLIGFKISADSARVVFRADKDINDVFELYSAPIATANATTKLSGTLVSGGDVESGFQISPDSTRVVFRADKDDVVDIYSAPIATANATTKLSGILVPGGGVLSSFQISPDSTRLVFGAYKDSAGAAELYSAPIATADATTKLSGTLVAGGDVGIGIQISADSARVVFYADKDSDTVYELYSAPIATANAATKISGEMVTGGIVLTGFQISPDSTRVVFRADKDTDGVIELYSVGTGGGGAMLDIDGDGVVLPTTDLLMLMRWQLGIRGAALFGGITFSGAATRTSVAAIEDHLRRLAEAGLAW